jgi:hypothetical protein
VRVSGDTGRVQQTGHLSPEAFWARYAEMEERIRSTATVLPCYGLVGWTGPRMVGDWEWENGDLVSVGLAHGDPDGDEPALHVHTTTRNAAADVASLRMADAGPPRDADDLRRRRRELRSAGGELSTLSVDGTSVAFTVWTEQERWWAAGRYGGVGLVLESRWLPVGEVELARVDDLEPYLAGRRAHLRALRGEP